MVKKLDKWCDNQWILFLCVTGVVTGIIAAVFWNDIPIGAHASIFVALIMPFHVLEEWKFPGGLHCFYNNVVFTSKKIIDQRDRYPMSRLTDMITNVGLQWIPLIYIILVYNTELGNAVALCMMLLSFVEVIAHTGAGFLVLHLYKNRGKKTLYSPGVATSYMMFLPAGVYVAAHIENVTAGDWLWSVVLLAIMMLICVPLTETPLKKWVAKQDKGLFAFEDNKYYEKYMK